MERKKFIKRFLALGGGAIAVVSGVKVYQVFKSPDLSFLKNAQPLIDELAEMIIPSTDTPGAKEAGAGEFVSFMVRESCSQATQNRFIDGLRDLAAYSILEYKKPYQKCSLSEKRAILSHFEKKSFFYKGIVAKAEHKLLGDPFFITLKKYTVLGYCSSELGATRAFNYDPVPHEYMNTLLEPGQKAWATQ
ncbi:MAG TPA: gluconate 2-dehydrogenase subunit 3 family protein [Chitinophagaceae bacterium]|nr:gluconate 2-dehydrogenase subunit 3 family protein [Chitinophagaceae bacterium]